jgi:tetratricopeptide (TPR) repeat protein
MPEIKKQNAKRLPIPKKAFIFLAALLTAFLVVLAILLQSKVISLKSRLNLASVENDKIRQSLLSLNKDYEKIKEEYDRLKNEDPRIKNEELERKINLIEQLYKNAVNLYEDIISLDDRGAKTDDLKKFFAKSLALLAEQNYDEAKDSLEQLTDKIKLEEAKLAKTPTLQNAPVSNSPPQSGYTRQQVTTEQGNFTVSMVAADIASTRVIVDTASTTDCFDNCPVMSLSSYVSRNNAFAGVNGSYFCPASYPSCVGKANSFDLLVMNKDKKYFNSSNNVYSSNPAVIFGNGYIRFVSAASQWGRDTSIDSMLSNYPLLTLSGNIVYTQDDDPKKISRGNRSFVSNKGNIVYIGVVHNASVYQSALVMKALGMENALNLDDGGSTALWFGGYKVGPGRDIPNAILFIRK